MFQSAEMKANEPKVSLWIYLDTFNLEAKSLKSSLNI